MKQICRVYAHYLTWEDYQHGMYRQTNLKADIARVTACSEVLANPASLLQAMRRVITEWTVSSAVNLSHRAINRQAWLGQAACCLIHGAPEHVTKAGWHLLTQDQQDKANAVADQVVAEWEASFSSVVSSESDSDITSASHASLNSRSLNISANPVI